jgi:phage regulator Rha-like protein
MGLRQLNKGTALNNNVVCSAFFITSLYLDTLHQSVFVVNNFQAGKLMYYLYFVGYFVISFVVQMDGLCQLGEWL